MRFPYSLIFLLLLPLILLRLYWKGRQLPAYRQHIGERLGFYPSMSGRFIWLHAVSVGETRAAAPLVRQLQQRFRSVDANDTYRAGNSSAIVWQ